jgi:hypothetical protein
MVDNQGTETPQSANSLFDESVFSDAPQEQGSTQENTLTPTDAFTEASGEEAPKEAPSTQEIAQPTDSKNDETRYQYWQSQAAQKENELKQLQNQVQYNQAQQQYTQQPVQQEQPPQEEFPPAPERPDKPHSFNRQEAYEDASSDSARYLDEMDTWRDNLTEYNSLKEEYSASVIAEQFQNQQAQQAENERVRQAQIQQAGQMQEVSKLVQGHYGMSQEDTQDFIKTMSNPSSITVDNLVQLYRLQKGQGGGAPVNPGQPAQPSPQFQQAQRAQQVPQPMGVQPTAGNNEAPAEDQIMDNMISDFKSKNPW